MKEVQSLEKYRDFDSLITAEYKEIFKYLDNEWSLDMAIEKIKTNTRRYAKRQITWFNRDHDIHWFHPEEMENILRLIGRKI